ncbi:unnamed protein product [Adineta steineri]|uniref:Uncharacterized protein n=1 Tax=Adineta steineri TaxID=433720 RepID=A0A819ZUK7_9BILA|nr:unnamed protein product [Adineta steineri]
MDPPINQEQPLERDWPPHINWLRARLEEYHVRVAQLTAEANEIYARADAPGAPFEAKVDAVVAAEALADAKEARANTAGALANSIEAWLDEMEAWADESEVNPAARLGG